jgi:hypothetical protein
MFLQKLLFFPTHFREQWLSAFHLVRLIRLEAWGTLGLLLLVRVCRRKIEKTPGAQSRDDTPGGGGHDQARAP